MSHFYAEIKGCRGEASRCGSKASGMWGHIRGWHVGAKVECFHDDKSGKDIVRVHKTTGSNGYGSGELIAEFCQDEGKNKYSEACRTCTNRFKCFTEKNERL